MKPNDVIESYVADVMRRVPGRERNDIGLELSDLLGEMLADRASSAGHAADDAMVLAMLREFGTPAEVAGRYRPPGTVIIDAGQTRRFAVLSLAGVALQWALTLPGVFHGQPFVAWWFSWGLGSLWWPGFLVMMALAAVGAREFGLAPRAWRPGDVDAERINRAAAASGLVGMMLGMAIVLGLPWIAGMLPGPLPRIFAFDTGFLHGRAWPVVLLWLDNCLVRVAVLYQGRWTPRLRRVDMATGVAWLALLAWWLAAGDIFQASATNDGAKAGLGLVILIVVADLVWKFHRRRRRLRVPPVAG
ncbi:MAG TPA: hypothetical protein VFJ04_07115 [Rhodanobacteraceae bacterium]|nr:hypothetical protein [Rhodanobacteraceae bacterium]